MGKTRKSAKKMELTVLFIILGLGVVHIVVYILALLWLNK